MEPFDEFERDFRTDFCAPIEHRETEIRRPPGKSLGWLWTAQHLVDDDCGVIDEQPLDTRDQLRALISVPDGGLHRWPYTRVRNRQWSDEPGFRDVTIVGDGAADELLVEVTDHRATWLVARAGEHLPDIRHYPISYIEPDAPQPLYCLADELLTRREVFSVTQIWLNRGRIPAGFEYRHPYPQPGLG